MQKVNLILKPDEIIGEISPLQYGHFAEHIGGVIYDGIFVGKESHIPNINGFRRDLIEKFKKIAPPVIRWPGGCFAEFYDWRDGIGENRPTRLSWWTKDDGLYESNEFGTHEFIEFCRLVGAEPYIAVNATSLTPMAAREWVDYCNSPKGTTSLAKEREKNGAPEPFGVKYWGIGNENWGGGGTMSAMQYALEYRKYATAVRNAAPTATLVAGAANVHSDGWLREFLSSANEEYGTPVTFDAVSLHYYYGAKDGDVNFPPESWGEALESARRIEKYVESSVKLLREFGKYGKTKLYIDEWGAMYSNGVLSKEKNQLFRQQITMRDAVATALTLHIFHKYCNVIEMANVAQLTNCLSSLFLTDGEACIETPIYHVFDMFGAHKGASAIKLDCTDGDVSAFASIKDEKVLITLANRSLDEEKELSIELPSAVANECTLTLLCSEKPNDYNSFDCPRKISPKTSEHSLARPLVLPRGAVACIRFPLN